MKVEHSKNYYHFFLDPILSSLHVMLKNYTELYSDLLMVLYFDCLLLTSFELDGLDVEAFCLEKNPEKIYIFRPQISFIINLIIL